MTMSPIAIFAILQIANVILSVMKSIIQVKGTKIMASIFNATYFSLYVIIVMYMVADMNVLAKIAITFAANLIGTYVAMTILEKARKDRLWKIETTISASDAETLRKELSEISYSYIIITDRKTLFTFYCATKEESKKVRDALKARNAKYFVSENEKNLY